VKVKQYLLFFIAIMSCFYTSYGQNVTLYQQFNGHYDFTFIGNTLNYAENNMVQGEPFACVINTTATATLALDPADEVVKAYLYWAGSGTGDFEVKLNGTVVTAERTFSLFQTEDRPFFSAFKDITNQVLATGNGDYTLSDLDLTEVIPNLYCNNATNFAGWAIAIIYKNNALPLNQINIYDGLQGVPDELSITLDNLYVINTANSKVGFIAWEGDSDLPRPGTNGFEQFKINGNVLSNPPLNPADNVFNGTNSITGDTTLYNMDLDIYDIQNNIAVGNTSATITLSSNQDFVMINTVITKLNNQLPDATIVIDLVDQTCNSRTIVAHYTVSNLDASKPLPVNTPIAIYANGQFIQTTATTAIIPIGGTWASFITLSIPNTIPANFILKFVVDDVGNGTGIVTELAENNNSFSQPVSLWVSPLFNAVPPQFLCVTDVNNQTIDLTAYGAMVVTNATDTVHFFHTQNEASINANAITNPGNFVLNNPDPTIFIRIDNQHCFSVAPVEIHLKPQPGFNTLSDIKICRETKEVVFDFSEYQTLVLTNFTDTATFYESIEDATANVNPIPNSSQYLPDTTPKTIFVRVDNGYCFTTTTFTLSFFDAPKFNPLAPLIACNEGFFQGTFNFSDYEEAVKQNPGDTVVFYENLQDAATETNAIINILNYVVPTTPKEIFVRISNETCYSITSFLLMVRNCPPTVYNYISANNDTVNDYFMIDGLKNIFLQYKIEIYNRWGRLIWTGDQNSADWNGYVKEGFYDGKAPYGNYLYLLFLNDRDYPEPLKGFLYLNH
jgi:gliding motility-associated-like protein